MEFEKDKKRANPSFEEVFKAFDECDLHDFVIERDHSLPREVDLDLSDEQIDDFMKWVSGLQTQIPFGNDKRERQEQQQRQKQILRCAQDDNV
jgi:hypothetical protein